MGPWESHGPVGERGAGGDGDDAVDDTIEPVGAHCKSMVYLSIRGCMLLNLGSLVCGNVFLYLSLSLYIYIYIYIGVPQ